MAIAEDARIEVPKALRSDMEAPKALNGVQSEEGCRKRIFGILFGRRTLLVDKNAIFSIFLNFRLLVSGGTSIFRVGEGGHAPSPRPLATVL